ncbi:MAG: response regulator [Eubacteriales bacterium]|nr:response regulator [Eubacteriales bacterium]
MGKILFVDDERLIREGIADLIDWKYLSGEELKLAENAGVALKYLEQERYEIVITDIYMQDINGIELAKQIKDRWPATKVILLSAYEDFEYAKEAIEAGVFKYLLKPVIPEELEDAVKDALSQVKSNIEFENKVLKTEEIINVYKIQMEKNLWKDIAYGNIRDESDIESRSRQLRLSVKNSGVCCVVIEAGNFSRLLRISEKAEEIASLCFADYLNTILINEHMVVLLKNEPLQAELFTLQDRVSELTDEIISVAVGSYVTNLLELPSSIEAACYKIREGCPNISEEMDHIVLKSIRIIREEIQHKDFNINTIARSLHVTPAYFSRIFKKRMGVTCIEFIQNYRVDLAKELLEFTNLSNQEIAEKTGYTSVYYFNQQFKKITGETPGYYRRKRQRNDVQIN